jgi:hypothetical protein
LSKSKNHKWNDDYDDYDDKPYVMAMRREAKKDKVRRHNDLLSNNDVQEEKQ